MAAIAPHRGRDGGWRFPTVVNFFKLQGPAAKRNTTTLFWPQIELFSLAFICPEISHDFKIVGDRTGMRAGLCSTV